MNTLNEVYQFMSLRYDITCMISDINTGKLRPKLISLDPEFVNEFAERVQGLKRGVPAKDQRVGIFSSVNAQYAMTLSKDRLKEPLILIHAPKGKGLLDLDNTGPNYLLGDGQHRLARLYLDNNKTSMASYQLSLAQSRKYML